MPDSVECVVAFRLTFEPREQTMGGLHPIRDVSLDVTVAAREYKTITAASEFLAELPDRARPGAFLSDLSPTDWALVEIVDEGEAAPTRDEDGIFQFERGFTLSLALSC